jgi:tetratricopeptide (TPR) repeat protein
MLRVRPFLLVLAWLTWSPVVAHAQEDWRGMQAENFYLVGDASEGAMRRVAERLEEFRSAFLAVRPPSEQMTGEIDTTVVVFDSDRDFEPYKPLTPDGSTANVGGVFLDSGYDVYIALTGEREAERAIYHEYIHQVSREDRWWPLWFKEGVAEFYSTIQLRDGNETARVGLSIPEHLGRLRNGVMIPIDEFLRVDQTSRYYNQGREQSLFYAQSWALVHYLFLKRPGGSDQMLSYLQLLGSGTDVETSFQTAFGSDYQTLGTELDLYIDNSLTLPAIDYRLDDAVERSDRWDAEDITEAEASYHLGEVLWRVDRRDEAVEHLERAIALAPDDDRPLNLMAMIYETDGDPDTAFEFFERAASIESAGYLPHLFFGQRALVRVGDGAGSDLDSAVRHLRRAVELRPDSFEAISWLGQALVRSPETASEAATVLGRAVELDDTDHDLAVTYFRALWMSGETERAQEGLETLLRGGPGAEASRRAEGLLSDIARVGDFSRAILVPDQTTTSQTARNEPRPEARPVPDTPEQEDQLTPIREEIVQTTTIVNMFPEVPGLPAGILQAEGQLTGMDCSGDGVRLAVETEAETVHFVAPRAVDLAFISYSSETTESIECGEITPSLKVRITYRGDDSIPDSLGDPLRVEFLAN